jgi:hypothetical protein
MYCIVLACVVWHWALWGVAVVHTVWLLKKLTCLAWKRFAGESSSTQDCKGTAFCFPGDKPYVSCTYEHCMLASMFVHVCCPMFSPTHHQHSVAWHMFTCVRLHPLVVCAASGLNSLCISAQTTVVLQGTNLPSPPPTTTITSITPAGGNKTDKAAPKTPATRKPATRPQTHKPNDKRPTAAAPPAGTATTGDDTSASPGDSGAAADDHPPPEEHHPSDTSNTTRDPDPSMPDPEVETPSSNERGDTSASEDNPSAATGDQPAQNPPVRDDGPTTGTGNSGTTGTTGSKPNRSATGYKSKPAPATKLAHGQKHSADNAASMAREQERAASFEAQQKKEAKVKAGWVGVGAVLANMDCPCKPGAWGCSYLLGGL